MRRREFHHARWRCGRLAIRGTCTQQAAKLPTIGFLGSTNAAALGPWLAAFVARLGVLGWIEGHIVVIEYRWGEGSVERYSAIAAEFVRRKVDIIVTSSTPAVLAAKHATSEIPIVFPTAGDPIATGLVESLVHPGGNVTGLGFQTIETAGKRIQLLRQIVPNLKRLAVLGNSGDPASAAEMVAAGSAAATLGLENQTIGIQQADEIAPAFETFKGRAEALYVATSPLLGANNKLLAALALSARLPTVHGTRYYVVDGGLMFYGANFTDLWRRAADMVDKILRGAKPVDLPVEQPTTFELIINRTTAKVLGLTIPASLLSLADELIE